MQIRPLAGDTIIALSMGQIHDVWKLLQRDPIWVCLDTRNCFLSHGRQSWSWRLKTVANLRSLTIFLFRLTTRPYISNRIKRRWGITVIYYEAQPFRADWDARWCAYDLCSTARQYIQAICVEEQPMAGDCSPRTGFTCHLFPGLGVKFRVRSFNQHL